MSRNKAQFFMALALGLVLTLPAFAQEERGGRRGGDRQRGGRTRGGGFTGGFSINKARLLGAKQVRTELKVTEEQGKKLDGVLASYAEESRKIRPQRTRGGRGGAERGGRGGRGGGEGDQRRRRRPSDDDDKGTEVSLQERPERPSDEEREKARKEYEKKRAALEAKFEKQIAEVLKKEQIARLNEIHYQQQGVRALLMASTVKTLKITKEQTKKIEEIISKGNDKRRELFSGLRRRGGGGERPDFTEIRKKMDALTKETFKEAVASLKKEQQEGHKKLTGKPFELDRRALFQRGGSERGGRGGARGGRGGEQGGDSDRRRRRPSDDDEGTEV